MHSQMFEKNHDYLLKIIVVYIHMLGPVNRQTAWVCVGNKDSGIWSLIALHNISYHTHSSQHK